MRYFQGSASSSWQFRLIFEWDNYNIFIIVKCKRYLFMGTNWPWSMQVLVSGVCVLCWVLNILLLNYLAVSNWFDNFQGRHSIVYDADSENPIVEWINLKEVMLKIQLLNGFYKDLFSWISNGMHIIYKNFSVDFEWDRLFQIKISN